MEEPSPAIDGGGTTASAAPTNSNGVELGGGSTPRSVRLAALAAFAKAVQEGQPGPAILPGELESIVHEVALSGDLPGYPWEDLRVLIAQKMDLVLRSFFDEVQDVQVKADANFADAFIRPLTQSLMKPLRDGAPFTVQRLCELLVEPRKQYKSTRKYLYALQRLITVQLSEDEVREAANAFIVGANLSAANVPPPTGASLPGVGAPVVATEAVGQKRKLPEELQNGTVEIESGAS